MCIYSKLSVANVVAADNQNQNATADTDSSDEDDDSVTQPPSTANDVPPAKSIMIGADSATERSNVGREIGHVIVPNPMNSVPFDGRVTSWSFYSSGFGPLVLLVSHFYFFLVCGKNIGTTPHWYKIENVAMQIKTRPTIVNPLRS